MESDDIDVPKISLNKNSHSLIIYIETLHISDVIKLTVAIEFNPLFLIIPTDLHSFHDLPVGRLMCKF